MKLPKFNGNGELIKIFTPEEIKKIESSAMYGYDDRYLGVFISLYTGLRIGEICALKYIDIDLDNSRLTISRSLKRVLNYTDGHKKSSVVEEEPKTAKSNRTIPIPQILCDLFKKRQLVTNSKYIISMVSGKYCEPRTFQFIYERMLEEADVTYRNFHCCRHTFVTR